MSSEAREVASDECLAWVKEALERHGVKMENCPPMFYPEAIHNLFIWGIQAGRHCLEEHGAQPQEHQVKCISEWIAKHQSTRK